MSLKDKKARKGKTPSTPTKREKEFKKRLWELFKDYHIDLSKYKLNRDELYDRP